MTNGGDKIIISAKAPDIPGEIRECLGGGGCNLTLAGFMHLVVVDSPYVRGGDVKADDLAFAMDACQVADDCESPHDAICDAIQRAFDVFGMVVANQPAKPQNDALNAFSPEWMADIAAAAMHAGLTYCEAMWDVPLVMVLHLVLAEYRRNGGETRRNNAEAESKAISELLKRRNKQNGRARTEGKNIG